jgi:polysaccharide export outer membrane protein
MFKAKATVVFAMLIVILSGVPAKLSAQTNPLNRSVKVSTQVPAQISPTQDDADRPALQHRHPRYQVMRDDVLVLTFPLAPEFNQTVTIQPDGYITVAGAGSIFIQGMTVPDVIEALKKAYSKILHDPIIDVDLKDFQKPYFIVSGQVTKPGQYDLRYDTTVMEAIAIAGSLSPEAKTQVFLFRRISPDRVEVKKLDLHDILHGKNVNEDAHLQPGDMIYVPDKFITTFKKYVPYSTGLYLNPGSKFF